MDRRSDDRRQESAELVSSEEERREAERRTGPKSRRGIFGSRRRFIVPGGYQARAILGVAGISLFLLITIDVTMYALQGSKSEQVIAAAPELAAMIREQDRAEMGLVMLASALGLLAVVALVLFESHKSAGPLYNLQNVMKRIRNEGGALRVKFRRDDHFKEIEEAFNDMMTVIEARSQVRAEKVARLAQSLRESAHHLPVAASGSNGASERLLGLAAELEQLKGELTKI